MKKFTRFLSLALATVLAVSVFSFTSNAKVLDSRKAAIDAHRRALTAEEITAIYPLFNAKDYANMYPDVVAVLGTDEAALFNHFVTNGIWEERRPSRVFDVDVYASINRDLHYAFGDDIVAYYLHNATHQYESTRVVPSPTNALWLNYNVYSVYDFEKGSYDVKKGAIPMFNQSWHPGIEWP